MRTFNLPVPSEDRISGREDCFLVEGGHGTLLVTRSTGQVLQWYCPAELRTEESLAAYADILHFDVREYTQWWGQLDNTDILLIGYWYVDAEGVIKYEPPEPDARARRDLDEKTDKAKPYRTKMRHVTVTKFEKMGDHPKVETGNLTYDDDSGHVWLPYSDEEWPVELLKEGDDPFSLEEEALTAVVNVFRRGYQPVIVGRYIVEDENHVLGVYAKEELERKYEPC